VFEYACYIPQIATKRHNNCIIRKLGEEKVALNDGWQNLVALKLTIRAMNEGKDKI
jgi:hypothetical protein